jgi:hypothetical protein
MYFPFFYYSNILFKIQFGDFRKNPLAFARAEKVLRSCENKLLCIWARASARAGARVLW